MAEKTNKRDEYDAMFHYNQAELRMRKLDKAENEYMMASYINPPSSSSIRHMSVALDHFRANLDLAKKTLQEIKQIDLKLSEFDGEMSKLNKGYNSEFNKGMMLFGKFVRFRDYLSADNPNYSMYNNFKVERDPEFKKWSALNVKEGVFIGSRISYGKIYNLLKKKLLYLKSLCSDSKSIYEQESID